MVIFLLHAYWVADTVRWVDVVWFLCCIYLLTAIGTTVIYLHPSKRTSIIVIAATVSISGPLSLLVGECGRRVEWRGVLQHLVDAPMDFAFSAYVGEIVSGAIFVHIAIPLLVLLAVPKQRL